MGRLLGLDFGLKRIGVAVTDDLKMISSPLMVIQNDKDMWNKLKKLIANYPIDSVVIGLPYSEKYKEAEGKVRVFGNQIKKNLNLPVIYQDEQFSTVYAELLLNSMGKKEKKMRESVDKYAAQKILEDYLKSCH